MEMLLNNSAAVFGQSKRGSSMVCQAGTPRSTMYALDSPANNIMIAVRRIQTPICPLETGNDDPKSDESPPPCPPGGCGGAGGIIPVRRSSVNTGITFN